MNPVVEKLRERFDRDTVKRTRNRRIEDPVDRFYKRVSKTDGCWNWMGYRMATGHGQFGIRNKLLLVHRYSYEINIGPIPEGMEIHHTCENPSCVNPAHLQAVTRRQHMEVSPNMQSHKFSKRTHCNKGHEFVPETTGFHRGYRYCRICERHRVARYFQRKVEEKCLTHNATP